MTDIHFYYISLNAAWNEKILVQSCRENQTTRFALNNFFTKSCGLCDNVGSNVKPDRPERALHFD